MRQAVRDDGDGSQLVGETVGGLGVDAAGDGDERVGAVLELERAVLEHRIAEARNLETAAAERLVLERPDADLIAIRVGRSGEVAGRRGDARDADQVGDGQHRRGVGQWIGEECAVVELKALDAN